MNTLSLERSTTEAWTAVAGLQQRYRWAAIACGPRDSGPHMLNGSRPELLRRNIACVDWSVAKGGFLCAYRWDGERELDAGKFVWTASPAEVLA
jgi:hypothetical protein